MLLAAIKKDQIGFFVANGIAIDINVTVISLSCEMKANVWLISVPRGEGQVTPVIGLVSHVLLAHFVNGEK